MIDHLIVHCTATPAGMDADAAMVDRMHRRKGWTMNGYNGIITRSSQLQTAELGFRARPFGVTGSHVGGCGRGWNKRSLGLSLAGGVKTDGVTPEDNFTPAQKALLIATIADWTERFNIPMANVIGHRDLIKQTNAAPKACPCFSVAELLAGDQEAFDEYDTRRLPFNWNRSKHPRPERDEHLVIKRDYEVQNGDTLWGISRSTGVRLAELRKLNWLQGDTIKPGDKLRLT